MRFVLIEANMTQGPKFASAPATAVALQVAAMGYCALNLTDGFVPETQLYRLVNASRGQVRRALHHLTTTQPGCSSASWEPVDKGWTIHDYDDPAYNNPTKVRLRIASVTGKAGGQRSAEVRKERYGSAQPLNTNPRTNSEGGPSEAPRRGALLVRSKPTPLHTTPVSTTSSNVLALTREAQAILNVHQELGGRSPSPKDVQDAEGMVAEFQIATAEQMAEAIHATHQWRREHGKTPIVSAVGWRETLRRANDLLRDGGQKSRPQPETRAPIAQALTAAKARLALAAEPESDPDD